MRGRGHVALLGLLILIGVGSGCGSSSAPERPPVVLVIIDTLRADHLGCYGYELDTSPHLDAFAAGATLFESNATQCNATFASITSILTGLYPKTHRNYLPVPLDGVAATNRDVDSLAERLGRQGYRNLAVVSHPAWRECPSDTALGRGWDAFSVIPTHLSGQERRHASGRADATNERAFALLDEAAAEAPDAPLFLWMHYFDPHTPYDPPDDFKGLYTAHHRRALGLPPTPPPPGAVIDEATAELEYLATHRALYDAEIRFCDEQIGKLFERLAADGLWDDALVLVMADHGENMEDPGAGHGPINFSHKRLFEGVAHTPLMLKLPGQTRAVRSASLTQNIDVLPTVIELLDLPGDERIEGRSLVPLLDDPELRLHEQVYMESSDRVEKAVKTEEFKYIERGQDGLPELYRWRSDPRETRDVLEAAPADLRVRLDELLADFRPMHSLRVRLVPTAEPSTVTLRLELLRAAIERVMGPGTGGTSPDGRQLSWIVDLDDEPVDLVVLLDRPRTEARWRIEAPGVHDRIRLGTRVLAETSATPDYVADGDPPDAPLVRLDTEPDALTTAITVSAPPAAAATSAVAVEWGFEWPVYGIRTERLDTSGFSSVEVFADPPRWRVQLEDPAGGRLELRRPADAPELLLRVLIDERWPDPARVALNGRGLSTEVLGFVVPNDDRVLAALLSPPDVETLPPGAIAIWTASAENAAEIDTTDMDPQLLEDLRELGYVK